MVYITAYIYIVQIVYIRIMYEYSVHTTCIRAYISGVSYTLLIGACRSCNSCTLGHIDRADRIHQGIYIVQIIYFAAYTYCINSADRIHEGI